MFVNLKNADIFTEIKGEGFPLLMIHGNWCDHRLMSGCMENIFSGKYPQIKTNHWKRIYFDLPGMGDTKLKSEITTTDDIFLIIDEYVKNILPEGIFYIASESYGSYLARMLVKKYQQRIGGIMMICPVTIPLAENRNLPDVKITYRDNDFYETLSKNEKSTCDLMFTIQNSYNWERYKSEVRSGVKKSDITLLKKIKKYGYSFNKDPDNLPEPFTKPSLIFNGRQDLAVGYKDSLVLLEKYPASDFVILDGAGHMLQIEQHDIFEKLTVKWLEKLQLFSDK